MRAIAVLAVCFLVVAHTFGQDSVDENKQGEEQFLDDVVVADAIFRGVYVGIVRLIQRIGEDDSGYPTTTVMVKLKHSTNDSVTTNHMWHVEHDPISGVNCSAENTHFAPFGITKQLNYTTYCSGITPDFCEVGDISTKTTLTSVGKDVVRWYSVPFLPVVGPWTVIGHSVNVHGGGKSKQRQACGNIMLNTRMTRAREVTLPVKMPENFQVKDLEVPLTEARMKIAGQLGIPIAKVQTAIRLDQLGTRCITNMKFLLFGNGTYDESRLDQLQKGKVDLGPLSPISCNVMGRAVKDSDSEKKTCEGKMTDKDDYRGKGFDGMDDNYEVVADAVFRGVYVGVVRMIQKVNSNPEGYPVTKVIVRLKHAANNSTTVNHMWHVEHDPIAGNACAATNTHYAPYGITKQDNYKTYCSGLTPDYCELGDISTKVGLTSLGENVVNEYVVPLLPVLGPRTMIGHSVNVHGFEKSKVRQACANILLNTKMTRAKFVNIPLKISGTLKDEDLITARIMMSRILGISVSKIHTAVRLDTVATNCTKMQFLIFDRGTYCPDGLSKLLDGKADIGPLTPTGCQISRGGGAVVISFSMILVIFSVATTLLLQRV